MKLLCLALFSTTSIALAQVALTWGPLPASVAPSQQFNLTFSSSAVPTGGWAAIQFSPSVTGATINSAVVATPSAAQKTLNCLASFVTCGVIGAQLCPTAHCPASQLNVNVITNPGNIATFTFTVTGVNGGTFQLFTGSVFMVDASGSVSIPTIVRPISIPIRTTPLTMSPLSLCDVDGNGTTDGADVTQILAQVLGRDPIPPGTQTSRRQGITQGDFRDVEIIINATSSGSGLCAATQ